MNLEQIEIANIALPALGSLAFMVGMAMMARSRKRRTGSVESFALQMHQHSSPRAFLEGTLQAACAATGADGGTIHLVSEPGADALQCVARWGAESAENVALSKDVFANRQSVLLKRAKSHPAAQEEIGPSVVSVISVPLLSVRYTPEGVDRSETIGVLTIWSNSAKTQFEPSHLETLVGIGNIVSLMVAKLVAQDFAVRTTLSALCDIAELLDAKDPSTAGHSRRVSMLGSRIARAMLLEDATVKEIEDSGRLLDLGRVAISDAILKKTTELTDQEFSQIKHHPVVSYEICRKLQLPESTLLLVRNHHERLDGSGYPDRLKGGEIPVALRIIAVADAFDAMLSPRHHRRPFSIEEALEMLTREAGSKFDAGVIEVVANLVARGELDDLYPATRIQEVLVA